MQYRSYLHLRLAIVGLFLVSLAYRLWTPRHFAQFDGTFWVALGLLLVMVFWLIVDRTMGRRSWYWKATRRLDLWIYTHDGFLVHSLGAVIAAYAFAGAAQVSYHSLAISTAGLTGDYSTDNLIWSIAVGGVAAIMAWLCYWLYLTFD